MIGEVAFKGFCSQAAEGRPLRALFIVPNAPAREQLQIDMLNIAAARGLNPVFNKSTRQLHVIPAVAYIRIAHPYLDRELKGLDWHFISGLEYLDAVEEGPAIGANLMMRVQS